MTDLEQERIERKKHERGERRRLRREAIELLEVSMLLMTQPRKEAPTPPEEVYGALDF